MKLKELLKKINILDFRGDSEVEILHLSQKVEDCKDGSLFFCFKGVNFDGHNFAKLAKDKGAVAIVCERFIEDCNITQIIVKGTRKVMFKICNRFYKNVIKKLKFVGVTGTNGKTTTTYIIKSILEQGGKAVGVIGTNGAEFMEKKIDTGFTTPDTVKLFEILNEMALNKIEYVVMEVSAHAIDLQKVKGIKFEVGIFTNLTQDHLDYFKSMHKYALCKLKFLNKSYCKNVVINTDDGYGKLFCKVSNCKVFSYGIDEPSSNFAMDLKLENSNSRFLINIFDCIAEIETNLICKFNVYNILASSVACKLMKVEIDDIVKGVKSIKQVEGRLNCYKLKNGADAIIDFAHTPDGLEKVLENLKYINNYKNIITVFGCGGNRDKTKRQKMGKIATELSDFVVVTNDNPRWEDEEEIIFDILKEVDKKVVVETNRSLAIQKAIEMSRKGDVVLIAGKGSEDYQEIKGHKYPYKDKDVVLKFC